MRRRCGTTGNVEAGKAATTFRQVTKVSRPLTGHMRILCGLAYECASRELPYWPAYIAPAYLCGVSGGANADSANRRAA
jgi:hypothetical protein